MNYIDLFAGAGGLSEGFVRAGYVPVAHVEMNPNACFTLKTRASYHFLRANGGLNIYRNYLRGQITREQLYAAIPQDVIDGVTEHDLTALGNIIGAKVIKDITSKLTET